MSEYRFRWKDGKLQYQEYQHHWSDWFLVPQENSEKSCPEHSEKKSVMQSVPDETEKHQQNLEGCLKSGVCEHDWKKWYYSYDKEFKCSSEFKCSKCGLLCDEPKDQPKKLWEIFNEIYMFTEATMTHDLSKEFADKAIQVFSELVDGCSVYSTAETGFKVYNLIDKRELRKKLEELR